MLICFVVSPLQVSMQHNDSVPANTEFEYLRNIMFQVRNIGVLYDIHIFIIYLL